MFLNSCPYIDSFAQAITCEILDDPDLFTSWMGDAILGAVCVHFSRLFFFFVLRKPIQISLFVLFNIYYNNL
jgi:hypothetical protein